MDSIHATTAKFSFSICDRLPVMGRVGNHTQKQQRGSQNVWICERTEPSDLLTIVQSCTGSRRLLLLRTSAFTSSMLITENSLEEMEDRKVPLCGEKDDDHSKNTQETLHTHATTFLPHRC